MQSQSLIACLIIALIVLFSLSTITSAKVWTANDFPNINHDPETCRTNVSYRLCDPDGIVVGEAKDSVETALLEVVQISNPCSNSNDVNDDSPYNVQIAVALVRKMGLDMTGTTTTNAAAEHFARSVHDAWGVGQVIPNCGGTGVLLFLSELDRAIYISRGPALESILTDRRLDTVIDHMKPRLREEEYGPALVHAIQEIHAYLRRGKPQFWEKIGNLAAEYAGIFLIFGFFGFAVFAAKKHEEEKRLYARVKSQLSEIDRAKAEALKGKYHCTSCPICLEYFKQPGALSSDNSITKGGEEEQPLVGPGENLQESPKPQQQSLIGSDGLPLKLLRCGHVFDDTCWSQWIESGTGQVNRCPICNADVGEHPSLGHDDGHFRPPDHLDNNEHRRFPRNFFPRPPQHGPIHDARSQPRTDVSEAPSPREDDTSFRDNLPQSNNDNRCASPREKRPALDWSTAALLRRYNYERNFRLQRLGVRYPTFVRPQQVARWTSSTYYGPLAQDQTFLERDPGQIQQQANANNRNGNGSGSGMGGSRSGFGGGSSGGGRGGSW